MGNDVSVGTSDENFKKVQELLKQRTGDGGKIIDINVGGRKFTTLQVTLDKVKDTRLEKMLQCAKIDKDGSIYIDRSPRLFEFILDALRTGQMYLPHDFEEALEIYHEIEYYGLKSLLLNQMFSQSFPGSNLVTKKSDIVALNQWVRNIDFKWKLLYQGTRDGFTANNWRGPCTTKSHLLVIIQSKNGNVFGGWTSRAIFQQNGGYSFDKDCFLFSLVNASGIRALLPQVFPQKSQMSINSVVGKGPVFGMGPDLSICDKCNVIMQSCASPGKTYTLPGFQPFSVASKSFLGGTPTFLVQEMEVFQLCNE